MKKTSKAVAEPYRLSDNGSFVIEDYNQKKPFSNFFPGLAGAWGIPLWVFYVNRGQGISSFGIESKDKAILEFLPANKAYRLTSTQGFRTFIKIKSVGRNFWEPFRSQGGAASMTRQTMSLSSHDLTIRDENKALGLVVEVNYFTLPGEAFPALIRRMKISNRSRRVLDLDVVDGLPMILPYGMKDWLSKNMSRTVEAWVKVRHLKEKAPFYHLNVEVSDTPDVKHIKEGNFYFAFDPEGKSSLLSPIVEAALVFGQATDFLIPEEFLRAKDLKVASVQQTSNRTPAAMCFSALSLAAGAEKEIISVIGHTYSQDHLKEVVRLVTAKGYVEKKALENKRLIDSIKDYAFTGSASREFNLYCGQSFLDNILRGGLPLTLKTGEGKIAFNVFSRKHGDPERDYNYFVLAPTYFSQGNGNYRDVNQNRRNDVWFNADVKDSTIVDFFNLSQADGYNPLIVKGMSFSFAEPEHIETILSECVRGECQALRERLQLGFQPGELLSAVVHNGIELKVPMAEFLERVLSSCRKQTLADHGEGFWSDHWTYNLDLVESYRAIYPEGLKSLLFERRIFSFYHNAHYVAPRDQRYLLTEKGVRQHHSVIDGSKEIRAAERGHKLRIKEGAGEVYHTTLLGKLLCLAVNKAASFDPGGVGIEMEADKPNWYDALNGLPGLLGSSLSETLELKRFCLFLLEVLESLPADENISLFTELATFLRDLQAVLVQEKDPAAFWHKANDAKEHYRLHIRQGIEGREEEIPLVDVKEFLRLVVEKARHGVERAKDENGLLSTYFYHEVVDHAVLDKKHGDYSYVLPVSFKRHPLPLFLEGFVHAMRTRRDHKHAQELYQKLRRSPLFDKKLKMYKVNSDLSSQSEEIGRARIFPRGWLENESIWLHMEYKYLLEILRNGLYEEFYATFKEVLIPFLSPDCYGRSILENSSFIVSSAHEDKALHGQGFVARLSGSTAEFLHVWLLMNAGLRPFHWDAQKGLTLTLKPALAAWLFTKEETTTDFVDKEQEKRKITLPKNTYAFNFLGGTLVVYHNPKRRNTFDPGAQIGEMTLTYPAPDHPVKIAGAVIPPPYADDIRENKVDRIDVRFE